jgi:hypothetical protein
MRADLVTVETVLSADQTMILPDGVADDLHREAVLGKRDWLWDHPGQLRLTSFTREPRLT